MLKLANAFSLNMLNTDIRIHVLVTKRISKEEAKELLKEGFENYIGHKDIANVVSNELGIAVEMNEKRPNLVLNPVDLVIGAQYIGPRLPEGATQLPENAKIDYFTVQIADYSINDDDME
ncbi:MAG: DUF1874 domain-containing protein [Candidatus Hydrothermia bacterium]